MKYLYYAIFTKNSDGIYEVSFQDLNPYAATFGSDMSEALQSAHDSLTGFILTAEDFKDSFNLPSEPESIKLPKGALLIPIEVDTEFEREKEQNTLIKKTLTIPKYLNDLGVNLGINFSETLTNALKQKLK